MNKVIIVGHSTTGIVEVEARLRRYGMQAPKPSRREGLMPWDITDSLCRAHLPARESDYPQIEAGLVWHGIAADLLLGNQDSEFWGWADTQSIHVLDYWRELDPLAIFLLVYDEPWRALQEAAARDGAEPTESSNRRCLDNWAAYNGAMLRFFLRHPNRCLLVNSSRVRCAPGELFELLDSRLPPRSKSLGESTVPDAGQTAADPRAEILRCALTLTTCDPAKARQTLDADAAERYLLDRYLDEQPSYRQLHDEMQASAHLPLIPEESPPDACEKAWLALVAQRRLTGEIIGQLYHERFLQLTQLHQIQEQLEYLHMRGQVWQKRSKPTGNEEATRREKPAPHARTGAADRVKQQLSYRLGATLVSRSRHVGGWLTMPFALAGEASRYRADQKRRAPQKLPALHTYDDAHEATRVKNHLSYRLGSVLVKHGRTPWGWFVLPFALGREWKTFKQSRKQGLTDPLRSKP